MYGSKDANGNPTNYNAYGELVSVTNALSYTTVYTYDAVGNLTKTKDPKGHVVTNTYNLNNELTRVEQPDNSYSLFTYDALGRIKTRKEGMRDTPIYPSEDPNQLPTTYVYDDLSRQWHVQDLLGNVTQYTYDLAGRLDALQDPEGYFIDYEYYNDGRLKRIDYQNSNKPTADVTFTYDTRGLRRTMLDATGTVTYSYDFLDRLKSVHRRNENINGGPISEARMVEHGYDLAGNLQDIWYPANEIVQGMHVHRTFDAANRMNTLTDFFGNVTVFGYDLNSNLGSIDYVQDDEPGSLNAQTKILYDALNLVDIITHTNSSGIIFNVDYGRDPIGLVGTADEFSDGGYDSHFYDYDAAGQIWQSGSVTAGQSPLLTTRNYDLARRLLALDETQGGQYTRRYAFDHDDNGNRTVMNEAIGGQNSAYTYDQANRLSSLAQPNWFLTNYVYDGEGLRQYKCFGTSCNDHFVWDLASGVPLLLMDRNAHYIYGPGGMLLSIWSPQIVERPEPGQGGGKGKETVTPTSSPMPSPTPTRTSSHDEVTSVTPRHYYYLLDQQASVRGLVDDNGNFVQQYSYDAYGTRQEIGGEQPWNPFGFVGQYEDEGSGLLYMRARYYDPVAQQFISRDPIDAASGQAYVYAGSNPVNFSDPLGTWQWPSSMFLQVPGEDQEAGAKVIKSAAGGAGGGSRQGPGGMQASQAAQTTVKSRGSLAWVSGNYGEDEFAKANPSFIKRIFRTSEGDRRADFYDPVRGMIHEIKTGYQGLRTKISIQIAKDVELLYEGEVKGVVWHFYRSPLNGKIGPTEPLRDMLIQNLFGLEMHP